MFIANYLALIKLGSMDLGLMRLAWQLKREQKTFLSYPKLLSFFQSSTLLSKRFGTPLQIAEFGVGRGGSSVFLAWLIGHYGGTLTLFDIFGRIPAPTEKDGIRAQERYEAIVHDEGAEYYGNIQGLLDIVLNDIKVVCDLAQVNIVQGRYEDTLLKQAKQYQFDLVHVDCDWYESSKIVFSYLNHNMHPGGIIQVDDYSHWQGSRMAVDEADWLGHFRRKLVDGALVIDTGVTN